jgi:hypothetical protein
LLLSIGLLVSFSRTASAQSHNSSDTVKSTSFCNQSVSIDSATYNKSINSEKDRFGIPIGIYSIDSCMYGAKAKITFNWENGNSKVGSGQVTLISGIILIPTSILLVVFSDQFIYRGLGYVGIAISPVGIIMGIHSIFTGNKLKKEADRQGESLHREFTLRYKR